MKRKKKEQEYLIGTICLSEEGECRLASNALRPSSWVLRDTFDVDCCEYSNYFGRVRNLELGPVRHLTKTPKRRAHRRNRQFASSAASQPRKQVDGSLGPIYAHFRI